MGINSKKRADDYYALAAERGLEWVADELPPNSKIKSLWRCAQGHEWLVTFADVRNGYGCPYCAGTAPKTEADYRALADKRGFIWLGPMVSTTKHKTRWRCSSGHEWESQFGHISRGSGCPFCSGVVRKMPADFYTLADKCGVQWLGVEAVNTSTKTLWRCQSGHEFQMTYGHLGQGKGCPICWNGRRGVLRRLAPSEYQSLAEERGYIWLGPTVANVGQQTAWQCRYGHEWRSSFDNLRNHGCPYCAQKAQKTPSDYHALAETRGFIWLGPAVSNIKSVTRWRCNQAHEFVSRYNSIQQGDGCPVCADMVNGAPVSRPQRAIHQLIGGELNYRVKRYAIDIAFPVEMIAIEYDGWYWHSGRGKHDAKRDTYLLNQGWRILRIKSAYAIPSKDELDAAISRLIAGSTYEEIVLPDWRGDDKTI